MVKPYLNIKKNTRLEDVYRAKQVLKKEDFASLKSPKMLESVKLTDKGDVIINKPMLQNINPILA